MSAVVLCAVQDTRRVYRDEINLLEVELLGREHRWAVGWRSGAAEAGGQGRQDRRA